MFQQVIRSFSGGVFLWKIHGDGPVPSKKISSVDIQEKGKAANSDMAVSLQARAVRDLSEKPTGPCVGAMKKRAQYTTQ